jgi:hypothetical protein
MAGTIMCSTKREAVEVTQSSPAVLLRAADTVATSMSKLATVEDLPFLSQSRRHGLIWVKDEGGVDMPYLPGGLAAIPQGVK